VRARKAVEDSLAVAQRIGMRSVEMNAWGSLGNIELLRGQVQRAIEHFQQSLAIAAEIDSRSGEANALNNLGIVYSRLNLWERAEDYLERVLGVARHIGDRRLEGLASLNLGNNHGDRRLWVRATDCYQRTVNIARELGDQQLEAQALGSLGRVYEHQGYFQSALNEYEKSLELQSDIGDRHGEALTLNNISNSHSGLEQSEQALAYRNQALSIAHALGDPDLTARILAGRGQTYARLGRHADACEDYRRSVEYIEKTRSALVQEEHRLGYLGWDKMAVYSGLILLLADRRRCGNRREALETVERSRSRAFLDQLGYTELPILGGIDPGLAVRERDLALALRERAMATRQPRTHEQRQKFVAEAEDLHARWSAVLDQLREIDIEYVALKRGEPATFEVVRACLQEGAL
ncbi:MAG: tetratricopeptide repeat protein, partial [Chloroflexota bacterium]